MNAPPSSSSATSSSATSSSATSSSATSSSAATSSAAAPVAASSGISIRPTGLSAVPSFSYSAMGVGREDRPNLGLVFSSRAETHGAAVFTTNEVKAAPVLLSQRHLAQSDVKRALVINSGVANAYTGPDGMKDAETCVSSLADVLGIPAHEVFVASTGVIGRRIDVAALTAAFPALVKELSPSRGDAFARAILTTDTRTKEGSVEFVLSGRTVRIGACVKGSGMIMPDMATMLACFVTDAAVTPRALQEAVKAASELTFNRISVDGDTSTNDTVFLLANGAAENPVIDAGTSDYQIFFDHLHALMEAMSIAIVRDGEGATKLITIRVVNAVSESAAKTVAMSIANSPLVKTAFFGEDLNWGRLAMAVGKARTGMDPERLDVYVNGARIAKDGRVAEPSVLEEAARGLASPDIDLLLDFKQGASSVRVFTCDLSYDYVRINADYTT